MLKNAVIYWNRLKTMMGEGKELSDILKTYIDKAMKEGHMRELPADPGGGANPMGGMKMPGMGGMTGMGAMPSAGMGSSGRELPQSMRDAVRGVPQVP